jgi:hypothetical protein
VSTSYLKKALYLFFLFFCFLSLSSCTHSFLDTTYHQQYRYLKKEKKQIESLPNDDFSVVFFVSARHLDYASAPRFLRSLDINPLSKKTRLSFGHAWFSLKGMEEEIIEGGHSGELGLNQAKYFEGVVNNIKYGYSNPDLIQKKQNHYERNPIKYLWETIYDGFFQIGNGGYSPTLALYVPLNKLQYKSLRKLVSEDNYNYFAYSISKNQCCNLIINMGKEIGLDFSAEKKISLPRYIQFDKESLRFWEDDIYSQFIFLSPDELEKSLLETAVKHPEFSIVTNLYRSLN